MDYTNGLLSNEDVITTLRARLESARCLLRDIYSITSYGDALASMRFWCKPDHNPYNIDATRKQIRAWLAEDGEE